MSLKLCASSSSSSPSRHQEILFARFLRLQVTPASVLSLRLKLHGAPSYKGGGPATRGNDDGFGEDQIMDEYQPRSYLNAI